MLENQSDQREVFILISLLFITLFQRARRARVILLQRLISRRIQRRRRAAFSQFLTIFAWQQQQRPKRVAWVFPRPQYWFETLFHSNALNMWWKENFRVSRETFNFICATRYDIMNSDTARKESSSRIVEVGNGRRLSFMWSYVRNCQVYSCWSMQGLCPSTVSTKRTIH